MAEYPMTQELIVGGVEARAETHSEWVSAGEPGALCASGEYLAVQLARILLNVTLKDDEETKTLTLLDTVWENLWDYRLNIGLAKVALVDTEGFQRRDRGYETLSVREVLDPSTGRFRPIKLPARERTLEGNSKVRMLLWFDSLTDGVVPNRLLVEQLVFSPGSTTGKSTLSESVELRFLDTKLVPAIHVLS